VRTTKVHFVRTAARTNRPQLWKVVANAGQLWSSGIADNSGIGTVVRQEAQHSRAHRAHAKAMNTRVRSRVVIRVIHTPECAGPGARNFRDQQGRWVGFSDAHIVRRTSQWRRISAHPESALRALRVSQNMRSIQLLSLAPTYGYARMELTRARAATMSPLRFGCRTPPGNTAPQFNVKSR
jgi:hypothetical protein